MPISLRFLVRYTLIAIVSTIVIGWLGNIVVDAGHNNNSTVSPVLERLLLEMLAVACVTFHLVALSVASLIGKFLTPKSRAVIYLLLSSTIFIASLIVLRVGEGLHVWSICCASLVIISLDYFWVVQRREAHKCADAQP